MPPSAPLPPHEPFNISAALPNLSPRPSPGSQKFIPPPAVNTICPEERGNNFKFYFLPSAWLSSGGASASWAVPSAWVWKPAGLFFKMPWKFALYGFLTPSLHGWGEGCFLDSIISHCPRQATTAGQDFQSEFNDKCCPSFSINTCQQVQCSFSIPPYNLH